MISKELRHTDGRKCQTGNESENKSAKTLIGAYRSKLLSVAKVSSPRTPILARLSTDKQANVRQIHELRQAAGGNGWAVVEVIETTGLSGNAKDADRLDRIR